MSWLSGLARTEILNLKSYAHAAWEPGLERLHANELPWRTPADQSDAGLNRYPEPQPAELIARLADLYEVTPANVVAGRGSDEMIDLLVRVFCRAGKDGILICPPTFGMYAVSAAIQGAQIVAVPLRAEDLFNVNESALLDACTAAVKLVFLCSPTNPTGNLLDEKALLRIAARLNERAVLVVDEAYIEFSGGRSIARHIDGIPHLVVLRTLSKAHGLAGARCGTLIANPEIATLLRKVITPYAIPQLTVEAALRALEPPQLAMMRSRIDLVCRERSRLAESLGAAPDAIRVWPSAANFLLVEFNRPDEALARARKAGLLIRDVRAQPGLANALRISVGTPEQNDRLVKALS